MTTPKQPPKKDVIYVDIEDDITSIIDKVKHADSSIVALVPPKRIGVLQSVVNLKLLHRAADTAHKRVVLITSDQALTALAAGANIPVAKNLQSKPELAEITALSVDDDEVIDGEEVPVDDAVEPVSDDTSAEAAPAASTDAPRRSRGSKVPDFDTFRNRLVLIVGGVLALIVFLIWAFVFAPKAVVTITAKTTPYSVDKSVTAAPGATLSAENSTLASVVKEIAKSSSVDFTATGKKDVGEKATGTVNYSNSSFQPETIPAGTTLTSSASGFKYVTNTSVTVPKGSCTNVFNCKPGTASGTVTATQGGSKYNTDSGSLSGAGSEVSAAFASPTSGGTDKTVTVVSEADAAAAREKLTSQNTDAIKAELKKQFTNDIIVIDESFSTNPGNPVVTPAIGEEASTAKITLETKFTIIGLKRSDVSSMVEYDLNKQIASIPNQSIYEKGLDKIRFAGVIKQENGYTMNIQTTGYVGPKIDAAKLSQKLAGKREGEIIAQVKTYEGIDNVAVNFSPFWVTRAPSADKVIIKFQVNDAN